MTLYLYMVHCIFLKSENIVCIRGWQTVAHEPTSALVFTQLLI